MNYFLKINHPLFLQLDALRFSIYAIEKFE